MDLFSSPPPSSSNHVGSSPSKKEKKKVRAERERGPKKGGGGKKGLWGRRKTCIENWNDTVLTNCNVHVIAVLEVDLIKTHMYDMTRRSARLISRKQHRWSLLRAIFPRQTWFVAQNWLQTVTMYLDYKWIWGYVQGHGGPAFYPKMRPDPWW